MKLEKVCIKGLKSYNDETIIDFGNYNVLVGKNNSGKSNVLFALRWFFGEINIFDKDINDNSTDGYVKITFKSEIKPEFCSQNYNGSFTVKALFKKDNIAAKGVASKCILLDEFGNEIKDISKVLRDLIEIIYIPAIRSVDDELKVNSKSAIGKLIEAVIVSELDSYKDDFSNAKDKINSILNRIKDNNVARIQTNINDSMLEFGEYKTQIGFNNFIELEKLIRDLIRINVRNSSNKENELDSQGMGFQRSLIFSLLSYISTNGISSKSSFIYLIEEPELYLHPNHQLNFRYKIKKLSMQDNSQIVVTTHSSYFVSNIQDYSEIKRIKLLSGESKIYSVSQEKINDICNDSSLIIDNAHKACGGICDPNSIAEDDIIRYLLWINPERANIFLTDKVLLVEGPSEKALFQYMLDTEFENNIFKYDVTIIDCVGKFHIYKFSRLLHNLGTKIWVVCDDDSDKSGDMLCSKKISHKIINDSITKLKDEKIIVDISWSKKNLESDIGIDKIDRMPDVNIYKSFLENKSNCTQSERYKGLKLFFESIISDSE